MEKQKQQRLLNFLQERMLKKGAQGITRRSDTGPAPLSFAQQRLWFFEQLTPGSPAYTVPVAFRLQGPLDVQVLERTLQEIVRRHDTLRTTFGIGPDNEPVQTVAKHVNLPLPVTDLSGLDVEARQAMAAELVREESTKPLDPVNGPILRLHLLRLGDEEHILQFTVHHIVSDGWSFSVLQREMKEIYEAFLAGKQSPLPELPIQYADFAVWQRKQFQGSQMEGQLSYWREVLNGAQPVLELPTDRPRPTAWSFQGAVASRLLPYEVLAGLKKLTQQEDATFFTTVMAVFQTLLHRYTGQEDLIVGSSTANRSRSEVEPLFGFFVNLLPIRTQLSGDLTFRELIQRVRTSTLGALAHQDVPFERLVEIARVQRDASRTPLVQAVCVLQNANGWETELGEVKMQFVAEETGAARFDLALHAVEQPDGLLLQAEYRTDLFDAATMERLLAHYEQLASAAVADPHQPISQLPMLTEAEREQILVEWNATERDFAEAGKCVHELFAAQAELTPDGVAAVFEGESLTYRELNERANQVAHALLAKGVQPDTRIGLSVDRSLALPVGVLGILKAGAAYVPIDPSLPAERIGQMLEDAKAQLLVTESRHKEKLKGAKAALLCLDSEWEREFAMQSKKDPVCKAGPEHLAYVIFTSGSTGRPKGVMIEHRSVSRFIAACRELMGLQAGDRVLQFASLSFDVSVFEIFGALLTGASLHLAPRETLMSPEGLTRLLQERGITVADLPPAMLAQLDPDACPSLRLLFVGTEAFSGELVNRWAKPGQRVFLNGYGPTEATVAVTVMDCRGPFAQSPPIGRPMANQQVYVLDSNLNPVPIGVPGELYIGGAGLARGYLNRPELTQEKFIAHPFAKGERLYKTGDRVRWLADGNLEFLGRTDQQVKLRGFRIELGDIEAALYRHPAIKQAVAMVRDDLHSGRGLVGYLVPHAGASVPAVRDIRRFLAEHLPGYMIPAIYVTLERLPLTPSGKIDHRALPAPSLERTEGEEAAEAPDTLLGLTVAGAISALLGVASVGLQDNFFELGGNSLHATQLISRLRDALGIELPLQMLFQATTVADLVRGIEEIDPEIEEQLELIAELEQMPEEMRQRLLDERED